MIFAHMVENGIESVFTRPIVVAAYLDSIKNGFGYQFVYVLCYQSSAYYTCDGLCKYIDIETFR